MEYMIVTMLVVIATAFVLLAVRGLYPKTPSALHPESEPEPPSPAAEPVHADVPLTLKDIFIKHGLSNREMDVALLMITEGLEAKEIGQRLNISHETVRSHIKNIYQKFFVKRRGEFMSLFVERFVKDSKKDTI